MRSDGPAVAIGIHNNCDDPRPGFVTVPLQALTGAGAQNVTAISAWIDRPDHRRPEDYVRAQIDRIDPTDPSRDVVSLFFDSIPKGGYVTGLETVRVKFAFEEREQAFGAGHYRDSGKDAVELFSARLKLYIQCPRGPWGWQGGAITSIQVGEQQREGLDAMKAEFGPHNHDPEKRIQLDRVSLPNPPWSATPYTEYKLYDDDWRYVTASSGAVRAFATIQSPMFTYDHGGDVYECHVYRVISLFYSADYVYEEIYVRGRKSNEESAVDFTFSPHFFLKMNCGLFPKITREPHIPDWFAIGTAEYPRPGFGFGASTPSSRIDNPPPDYPSYKTEHGAFGWDIGFSRLVRCFYLLRSHTPPNRVADETGQHWFDLIFRPPRPAIVRTA